MPLKYAYDIPNNVCNRNQSKKDFKIHPIRLTDPDHNYILEEIERREKLSTE